MGIRRRNYVLGLLLVMLLAGGGYYFYSQQQAAAAADTAGQDDTLQTATARRGNIIVSALGAGSIIPADEITIGFTGGGTLVELAVRVGQQVEAGDILARIDHTAAQEALLNAQLQLSQQNIQADGSQTATGVSLSEISLAQAKINLTQANTALADLRSWEPDETTIAQAEADLTASQANYDAAVSAHAASGNQATIAGIAVTQAQRDLADAQAAYDTAFDSARDWELSDARLGPQLERERESAENRLVAAQESLTIAQVNYSSTASVINNSSLVNAETNLLNAQLALNNALLGPTEDEIAAAEIAVQQAELSLQQSMLNQENTLLSLEQAKLNVVAAEAALAETNLYAPVSGTIMAVTASVGELATASLITMADLEQPILEVFLDESDFDSVGLDFEAEIVFDAFPDDTFVGEVIQVDPQLYTVEGVAAVRAVIALDQASFDQPRALPVGLNATVEIIGGRATNTVLVPVEALRQLENGQFAVFVMQDDEPMLTFVEVGLLDFTFAEILSGVEAGDIVSTGLIDTE